MVKTFLELAEIDSIVGSLYKADPKLRETKFGYAYTKFYKKNYEPILNEFKEQLEVVRIDHALEDEKTKAILKDENTSRGYQYSKQGLKDVMNAEKEITKKFEIKEITIEPYISSYIPEMADEQKEILTGIVL